jgi:hypothetical protein
MMLAATPALAGGNVPSCTAEDREQAAFWEYYDPEEARAFGAEIMALVARRDIGGLIALGDAELAAELRLLLSDGRALDDLYGKGWTAAVLAGEPPCSPTGWRGFMLAYGLVWYNRFDDGWKIFGINRKP